MTKSTAALAFALAVSSSNAFVCPNSGLRAARTAPQATVMRAEKSASAASAAAVVAAGVLLQGAMAGPVQAENFETAAAPTTYLAGFGQPNPSSDPENNNAASGKTESDKYNVQQQGSFSKKYSAGNAADYGSPKGTDFGPTAGNNPDAASNDKGTAGPFRADAERPENQGKVNIAKKDTSDAANVDVKSVAKDPNAVKGPNPADAKQSVASAANSAKTAVKKATSGGIGDIFSSNGGNPTDGRSAGGDFGFGVIPGQDKKAKGPADNVRAEVKKNGGDNAKAGKGPGSIGVTASNPADGLKKSIDEGKNILASATGAVSEAGDKGGNAATKAATTAGNKVSNANAGGGGVGDAAQSVAQSGANKVGAGADAAKSVGDKVRSEVSSINLSLGNLGNEAEQAKNNPVSKVQKDLNTAKDKVKDDVTNVAKNTENTPKVGGFFEDPRGQQETIRQKVAGKASSDKDSVASTNIDLSLGNLGNEADQAKNSPASKVQKDLNTAKNKVKDDVDTVAKNTPQAGGFFSNPREQQETVRQKTVDKVKSDVKSAGSNINLSLGNLGNEADQAKNNPAGKVQKDLNTAKNKVKDDVDTVAKNQPKAGGFFWNPREQQETVRQKTVDKVKSDVKSAGSNINLSLGNLGNEADQAKNNPLSKVQKDLNVAKNKVAGDVSGKNNPEVGGFFGKDSDKQAQNVGQKTANKVGNDLNEAKKAVESARNTGVTTQFSSSINLSLGNIGNEADQAKNNPFGKVQKDLNVAKNKVAGDVSGKNNPEVGGFFGKDSDKQAQTAGQKTANKVGGDLNEVKKAVESARNEGVKTKFAP